MSGKEPVWGAFLEFVYPGMPEKKERMITLLRNGAEITDDILYHVVDLRAYAAIDIILENGGISDRRKRWRKPSA